MSKGAPAAEGRPTDVAFEGNAAGRSVPLSLNGRAAVPFQGVGAYRPAGNRHAPPIRSCADYPSNGDKRAGSMREALESARLRNGATVSTHHHLRNGDFVAMQVFEAAEEMGLRDLVWFPSAAFPCHAELIPLLERGVIARIESSLNGPLGEFATRGGFRGEAVLRSHGSRYRSIQDGDVQIDVAVLAAPACDSFGNATGALGPSACGSLGFGFADAQFADHVIVATDGLVPFPCLPYQIPGNLVDAVVEVERIGDPAEIVSGTTVVTRSPDRLLIAELAAAFVREAGILKEGFSFQAGAGGTSLAFTLYLRKAMLLQGVRASFARGGSTRFLVEMLEGGEVGAILDGQTFDAESVRSMRENPRHVATSPFNSYNYHGKGNTASMVDVAVLGATEIDLEFNANVATHSDGVLQHGLGGWQDALFARCAILAVPSLRNRVPILRDRVTTLCGTADLIDVVVTERGIAVNPLREDLLDRVRGSDLPIRTLEEIHGEAERICGPPAPVEFTDDLVGAVTWVDGTCLDSIYRPLHLESFVCT